MRWEAMAGGRRSLWLAVLGVGLAGCGRGPAEDPVFGRQRAFEREWMPAAIVSDRNVDGAIMRTARVRIHADQDFRGQTPDWQRQVSLLLSRANHYLEKELSLRLEVESALAWNRRVSSADLVPVISELRSRDPGDDIDWVIGFTSSLAAATTDIHHMGMGELGGKHLVLRNIDDRAEAEVLGGARWYVSESSRSRAIGARRQHKEIAVLLHELGHTLGLRHGSDPDDLMSPQYSARASGFSLEHGQALRAALAARMTSAAEMEQAAAPELRSMRPADRQRYRDAQTLLARGQIDASWLKAEPLLEFYPELAAVQALGCALAMRGNLPEKRDALCGLAARSDVGAALSLVETALDRGERATALARLRDCEDRLAAGAPAELWMRVAAAYRRLEVVSGAERAAQRAGEDTAERRALLAWARRLRARNGLPPHAERHGVTAALEADYVRAVQGVFALLYRGDEPAARALLRATARRFRGAPGLEVARCDLAMRSGHLSTGERHCRAAIAGHSDASWAHFLLATALARRDERRAAIEHLERAVTADPELDAAWQLLARLRQETGDRAGAEAARQRVPPATEERDGTATGAPAAAVRPR